MRTIIRRQAKRKCGEMVTCLVTILLFEGGWEITSVEFSHEDLKKNENRRCRIEHTKQ